ncbi:MAG: hypothetical protein DYH16_05350, partial [Nitrosomonas sp. PRO5]|nr:hypothetical protein [Nitrosomonas sp. PRO5]
MVWYFHTRPEHEWPIRPDNRGRYWIYPAAKPVPQDTNIRHKYSFPVISDGRISSSRARAGIAERAF